MSAASAKNKINMKHRLIKLLIFIMFLLFFNSCSESNRNIEKNNYEDMMIRIAEIEIDSIYLKEYISILKEEAEASVRLESGVICIYPMFQKDNPTEIRLLEIYANKAEYESHLKTPHFQHYKTTTLNMVKSLRLVEMEAIDKETMVEIFAKHK
jgi:quinol monooxygenase YgiN